MFGFSHRVRDYCGKCAFFPRNSHALAALRENHTLISVVIYIITSHFVFCVDHYQRKIQNERL